MPEQQVGNGAREALLDILTHHDADMIGPERETDIILTKLWLRGFKIVPLSKEDEEAA